MNTNIRYRTRGLPRTPNKRIQPGEKFGSWIAIKLIPNAGKWLCRCVCGKETPIQTGCLRNGGSKSCGCVKPEPKIKHGMAGSSTYMIWACILQRCNNKNATAYQYYGGRGIKVTERWLKFENFIEDMGPRPAGRSIDRIDPNGHYCKENCRWATISEQNTNKRNSIKVTFKGETLTLQHWANKLGVNSQLLYYRYQRGWPIERLFMPPQKQTGRT